MGFVFENRASDSPFVELMWQARSETPGPFTSIAGIHWEMVVTRHHGETTFTVRGPETKATFDHVRADVEWFGITFRLGTFMPHLPARNLLDRRDAVLPEATSNSFWLNGSAWQFPTFENADTFVERLVREGLIVREPVVDAALQGQYSGLTLRSVQSRFLYATGLTQSTVQQIERARLAMTMLRHGISILDTVHEAGYFDQPHLTRSLKRFIGQTPAQIASQIANTAVPA
jgi:AraC-like DNA-binding protein